MEYLDKIFLWLGNTTKNQQQFDEYFKIDYTENSNREICGFCQDIGEEWYDEDFIGYLRFDEKMSVSEVLKLVPISLDDVNKVLEKCKKMNINSVNSVYWYSGEIAIPSENKKYNELFYFGEYGTD